MPRKKNAAVFIRCSEKEAAQIRQAANVNSQTLSRYILDTLFGPTTGKREKVQQEIEQELAGKPKP